MNQTPNFRGEYPSEMIHNTKVDSTDDEEHECPIKKLEGTVIVKEHEVPLEYKSRLYQKPDFAFVVQKSSMSNFEKEIRTLVQRGSVYYEVFDREGLKNQATCLVVVFFDDPVIDTQAEVMKVRTQLKEWLCLSEFKAFARDSFKSFNGR